MQIGDGGHDVSVRVRVVEGRVACWEGGWGGEGAVGGTELGVLTVSGVREGWIDWGRGGGGGGYVSDG